MAPVKIAAVTPVHNRKDLTLACLRSLLGSDLTGIELHVVIVDDGSTDGTAEAIRKEFPSTQVVSGNGDLWYTGGMNAGITAAIEHDPDYVLGFNNDSEFEPTFLRRMLSTASKTPRSLVGAVLVDWDDRKRVFQVGSQWRLSWGGLRHWTEQSVDTLPPSAFGVDLLVGNCLLIPTAAIRAFGLMDARRFPHYGDAEYTTRMRRGGWNLLIEPGARVFCKPNDPPERLSKMPLSQAFRSLLLNPHHPHSLRRRLNTTVATAPTVLLGYAAFLFFFVRYAVGRNYEREWGRQQPEPPLSEIYSSRLVQRRRHLLYVWNYLDWGGAQVYFLSLMKAAKAKFDVRVLLPTDSDKKLIEYIGALDIQCDFLGPAPPPRPAASTVGRLARRIALWRSETRLIKRVVDRRHLQDTIVHIDLGFWQSLRPLYRLSNRTNVVMTVHTALPTVSRFRSLLWKTKGRIISRQRHFHLLASNVDAKRGLKPFVSTELFDSVEVAHSGFDPDEIAEVSEEAIQHSEIRGRHGIAAQVPLLVTTGQFIERKGCWTLLDSLRQLIEDGIEFVFLWLATARPDPKTLEQIERYDLGRSFRLMAPEEIGATRLQLLRLVRAADLFVLASYQEGLPISLVEAMALGRPCIATNVGAIPEAIRDDENGLLIEPGSSVLLTEAIADLLGNAGKRHRLGAAAAETARFQFNAAESAQRVTNIYDTIWQCSSAPL